MRRREFIALTAGTTLVMPFAARAAGHGGDAFELPDGGTLTVHPVQHASVVLETPGGTVYVDPVGGAEMYEGLPSPDLILVTHEHGDHYHPPTLAGIAGNAPIVLNPATLRMVPGTLSGNATAIGNGETTEALGMSIEAIPAHNLTEGRMQFHPPGRDNGYVLDMGGFRVYLSGDTEDVPEMRALEGIDLAFVCMNLPFTMTDEAAADAVKAFRPKVVYPYHYRGRGEDGTQDPEAFAQMVGDAAEVRQGDWYG